MTTNKKLWLGFGILTVLLLLFGAALTVGLRSIESNVEQQANIARPRSEETRQLEINVAEYALGVSEYLRTGDAQASKEAADAAADVERHRAEYERLIMNDPQRQLAARFAAQWQAFQQLGKTLLDAPNRQPRPEDIVRFHDLRVELEKFLDNEMQVEAIATYNARRDTTFTDLQGLTTLALILLGAGMAIAALTSVIVGRSIVSIEQLVYENRELLRVTLASIGDAVMTTDSAGRITFLNQVAQSLTGWTQQAAEGKPADQVFQIVNKATRAPVESPVERVLRDGRATGLANHTLLVTKDGREIPIDDSGAPIRAAQGALRGVVLVFRDITERKQAEADLSHQKTLLEALTESVLDGILIVSPEGRMLHFNRHFLDIWNFPAEVVETQSDERALQWAANQTADSTQFLAHVTDIYGQPNSQFREELLMKDGRVYERYGAPIQDGETRLGWLWTFRDITERKQQEEKLRASQQQYEALVSTSAQIIWETNAEGAVETDSPTWSEFTGQTFDEWKGFGWLEAIHPEDQKRVAQEWQRHVETKTPLEIEYRARHTRGEWRWMTARATPILNADGSVRKWVGMNTDITERKQAALALAESEARYRFIVENTSDGTWQIELTEPMPLTLSEPEQIEWYYCYAVFSQCNLKAARMYGYASPDQVIGLPVQRVMPPDNPVNLELCRQFIRSGYHLVDAESREVDKDGRELIFLNNMIGIVEDGKLKGEWGTNRDITARKQQEEKLQASETRYRTIFETATVSLWEEDFTFVRELTQRLKAEGVTDFRRYLAEYPELVREAAQKTIVLDVNPETLKMLGAQSTAELLGSLDKVFLPESLAVFAAEMAVIAEGGGYFQAEAPARTLQGARREFLLSMMFPAPDEPIDRVLVSVVDITARKQAEETKEFLTQATTSLAASLEFDATLEQVAQLAVPKLADWCAVHILMDDGMVRRLAFAHHDPAEVARVTARPHHYPLDVNARHLVSHVIRTGVAEFYNKVPDSLLQEAARDEQHLETLRQLGMKAYLCMPFQARGRTLGTVTFAMSDSGRTYSSSDVECAEELVRRAGLAADNARLFQEAQAARTRSQIVAEASAEMSASLDYEARMERLAQLVVPRFADWCAINLVERDGTIRLAALAHKDPAALPLIQQWAAEHPLELSAPSGTPQVIRTGKAEWVSDVEPREPALQDTESDRDAYMKQLRIQSYMIVPLIARGRTFGAISFYNTEAAQRFSHQDLVTGEEIARRAAVALDNAALYLQEQTARQDAEENARRVSALQNVTSSLSLALTADQVADIVIEQGIRALDARAGSFSILDADGEWIETLRAVGHDDKTLSAWQKYPVTTAAPIAEAIRKGKMILISNESELRAKYPEVWERQSNALVGKAWAALPMVVETRVLGALGISFTQAREFDVQDAAFMNALSQQSAYALERALLYEAERQARAAAELNAARVRALQRVTATLGAALTSEQVGQVVLEQGTQTLGAASGAFSVLSEDKQTIEMLSSIGYTEETIAAWRKIPADQPIPLADAIRRGEMMVVESLAQAQELYPKIPFGTSGNQAWMILPLRVKDITLGGLWLSFQEARVFSDAEREFALALARQSAQALERARLYESESVARRVAEREQARSALLAEISAATITLSDLDEMLQRVARTTLSIFADYCVIDMVKEDELQPIAVAHVNPNLEELAWELVQTYHPRLDNPDSPSGRVAHTGEPALYPVLPVPENDPSTLPTDRTRELLRALGLHSSLILPLVVQGRVLGVMNLGYTESGRHYAETDIAFGQEIARRVAVAMENARLYRETQTLNAELEERVQERTFQLSEAYKDLSQEAMERARAEEMTRALLRISNKLNSTLDVQTSLDILIQEAIRMINGTSGFVGLRTPQGMKMNTFYANGKSIPVEYTWEQGKGLPGWVLEHAAPYVTNDAPNDPVLLHDLFFNQNIQTAICTPILDAQDQVMGFFEIRDKLDGAPITGADVEFLKALSPIASIALENAQAYQKIADAENAMQNSYSQLRALAARLQTIREEERTDIARELHDELGQALTALKMDLAGLLQRLPLRNKYLRERAQTMSEQIDATIKTVRRMSSQLRPGMLDDLGLGPSIQWYAQEFQTRTNIIVETVVPEDDLELGLAQATALFRIFQETLTNVARHAEATLVQAKLEQQDNMLILQIADNGKGFDMEEARGKRSLGLLGMRERAEMIQGTLEIQGELGKGTTTTIHVPIGNGNR